MPSTPPVARAQASDPLRLRALEAELRRLSAAVKSSQKLLKDVNPDEIPAAVLALSPGLDLDGALRAAARALEASGAAAGHGGDPRIHLSRTLRAACAEAGLPLRVEGQAPLRLRVDPIVVDVDLDANRALLRFAEQPLARCAAEAGAILAARAAALAELEGPAWDPLALHRALRETWAELGPGWQPLRAALPRLCWRMQPPAFLRDPQADAFVPYPRARFAFDLVRLRRARALSAEGWRLCVAPATGSGARDKDEVLLLEDPEGGGQWHRSFCFVPEEPA